MFFRPEISWLKKINKSEISSPYEIISVERRNKMGRQKGRGEIIKDMFRRVKRNE